MAQQQNNNNNKRKTNKRTKKSHTEEGKEPYDALERERKKATRR